MPGVVSSRRHASSTATVEGMRSVIIVAGVLVALAGLLFTLQGFGAVSGSPMSNTTTWSVLGPIVALIGIAISVAAWRIFANPRR